MSNNRRSFIEKKISELEDRILQKQGDDSLKISVRHFSCFLLIGGQAEDELSMRRFIRTNINNAESVSVISINSYNEIENAIQKFDDDITIAKQARNIDDLLTVMINPIHIVSLGTEQTYIMSLNRVGEYLVRHQLIAVWQPFLVLRSVTPGSDIVKRAFDQIEDWIRNNDKSNKCCVLSTQDTNNFDVQMESVCRTAVLTAVLQDIKTNEGKDAFQMANTITRHGDPELFFTSSGFTIENPIQSAYFNRLRFCVDYFSHPEGNSIDDAWKIDNNYSYIQDIIRERYNKLPRYKNRISFFPLYAVIDGANFETRLYNRAKKNYMDHLEYDGMKHKRDYYYFFYNYLNNCGNLTGLTRIAEKTGEGWMPPGISAAPIMGECLSTESAYKYNKTVSNCKTEITRFGAKVFRGLVDYLGSDEFHIRLKSLQSMVAEVAAGIDKSIVRINRSGTVLVAGRTETGQQMYDVQCQRVVNYLMRSSKTQSVQKSVNDLFAKMLTRNDIPNETLAFDYLELCYDIVDLSIKSDEIYNSNSSFIERLGKEPINNGNEINENVARVRSGTLDTIQVIREHTAKRTTYVICDTSNTFCKGIIQSENIYPVNVDGIKTIAVLHVSEPFIKNDVNIYKSFDL